MELEPGMGLAHYSLAVLYLEQNVKLDEALEHARRAVELNSVAEFIAVLAGLYYEKAMYADAEREIKRAVCMEPENEKYRAMLAEIQKKIER